MKRWFTEKLVLKIKTGIDKYNKPVFDAEVEIMAKMENKQRIIRNLQGEEIVSSVIIFTGTNYNISVGDYISGHEVINSTPIRNYKGKVQYLEVLAK